MILIGRLIEPVVLQAFTWTGPLERYQCGSYALHNQNSRIVWYTESVFDIWCVRFFALTTYDGRDLGSGLRTVM